jgi:hypothetical protein
MGLRFRARFYSATRAASGWEKLSRNSKPGQAVRLAREVSKSIPCCGSVLKTLITVLLSLTCAGCLSRPVSNADDLGAVIRSALQGAGSDIEKVHAFDFYLYFPAEAGARAAGERLKKESFAVEVRRAANADEWLCLARKQLTPKTAPFAEYSRIFEMLATEFNGDFDGWEAEVVKR